MKLGYFTMPLHPPERDYVQTLTEDRQAILLADELGYSEAFVGEHVTDVAESVTDSCVFLASLAHLTRRITLGTGTVNLPNGHPAAIVGLEAEGEGTDAFRLARRWPRTRPAAASVSAAAPQ